MCSAGTYKDGTGTGPCTTCPAFSNSSAGSSQMTDCSCIPGYTGPDGGACAQCSAGTYKTGTGSQACDQCPAFSSSFAGSFKLTDCSCILGYNGTDGDACTACPEGSFKNSTGPGLCLTCPALTSSSEGSALCLCIAGHTGPDGGACSACREGSFKADAGSDPCPPCPEDSWSNQTAATGCISCAEDAVSARGSSNQAACRCRVNFEGADGGPCVVCRPGSSQPLIAWASSLAASATGAAVSRCACVMSNGMHHHRQCRALTWTARVVVPRRLLEAERRRCGVRGTGRVWEPR
eukprot:313609-Rhodomonas_salina.1